MLLLGSGFEDARIELGGLLVHPYLALIAVLLPFVTLPKLARVPPLIITWMGAFLMLYLALALRDPSGVGECLKISAAFATFLTAAFLTKNRADLRAASTVLCLVAAVFAVRGMTHVENEIVGATEMLDIGGKNAYSLLALPGLLLGGAVALDRKTGPWLRVLNTLGVICIAAGLFATGNRSGWLGVLVSAFLLLARGRSLRAGIALGVLAIAVYWLLNELSSTAAFERRWNMTFEGYGSDETRWDLFVTALQIGLENPVLGASPEGVYSELPRRLDLPFGMIDTHNVFGFIVGGFGLITTTAFLALGYSLWRRQRPVSQDSAHILLRHLLILWVVRGSFSREVLYAPAFFIALGVAFGLCLQEGVWRVRTKAAPQARAPDVAREAARARGGVQAPAMRATSSAKSGP